MTHCNDWWVEKAPSNEDPGCSDFQVWQVFDIGGFEPRLKVRYCDGVEVPDWQNGPDFSTALRQAEMQGWQVFDSEPGIARDQHSFVHLRSILER
jgi:hypothetical protein